MMARFRGTDKFTKEQILGVASDPNLAYWLGQVASEMVPGIMEKTDLFSRLTDVLAKDHAVSAEIAEKGILIAEYRRLNSGIDNG